MTDNEIIKALECCSIGTFACDEQCPYFHSKSNLKVTSCRFELIGDALDLINRQKAEIEALIAGQETLQKYMAEQKAEIEGLGIELKAMRGAARSYKALIDGLKENGIIADDTAGAKAIKINGISADVKELVGEDG